MDLLDQIGETAAPGRKHLDRATRGRLRALTTLLMEARPEAAAEFRRFLAVQDRMIPLAAGGAVAEVHGRTVLVTGGSGCIGTALCRQLIALRPARVISVATTPPNRPINGVEYRHLDIRDSTGTFAAFRECRPDVVFHLAAQRDPGLAERQVVAAVSTNVTGTLNVSKAARRAGASRLIYASTGKAVRPYTTDIYAGSKRIGEWIMSDLAAQGGVAVSGVRFTHVVDNSIILDRLRRWCARDAVVRLHSADTRFYVQSAVESAQLLLTALAAPLDDVFRLHMIRDLDWPVGLLDLALGAMFERGRGVPLYLAGHDPGYEVAPYSGLYDPVSAGDVSPLLNALEAPLVEHCASPAVDAFCMPALGPPDPALFRDLRQACRQSDAAAARRQLALIGQEMLAMVAWATPIERLDRVVALTERHRATMTGEHQLIDSTFRAARSAHAPALMERDRVASIPRSRMAPAAGGGPAGVASDRALATVGKI